MKTNSTLPHDDVTFNLVGVRVYYDELDMKFGSEQKEIYKEYWFGNLSEDGNGTLYNAII
jgi:hypothetical protein